MDIAAIANTVAVDYLATAMPTATRKHSDVLCCCILNAITDGITDDNFLDDVVDNRLYNRAAKTVFEVVGSDIIALIEKTQEATSGTPS